MCEWKIERVYPVVDAVNEISVAIDGFNGGFCALPQEGISCELSAHDNFGDIGYNTASLNRKLKSKAKAHAIAEAIWCEASRL